MMPVAVRSAILILLTLGSSLSAQDYRPREVEGWTVGPLDNRTGCLMTMEYEGEGSTNLTLSIDLEHVPSIVLSNSNWSVKEDDQLFLDYELSNGVDEKHMSFGIKEDVGGGFGSIFEKKFSDYLARSTYLRVAREGKTVDRLSLKGSGAAVAQLKSCVYLLKAKADAEAREKARLAHIPRDPFAEH